MCVCFSCIHLCTPCMCLVHSDVRRRPRICWKWLCCFYVCALNWTWVLCISNKCSELLHHLSSLITTFLVFLGNHFIKKQLYIFYVVKRVKHLREKLIRIFYIWFPILIVCPVCVFQYLLSFQSVNNTDYMLLNSCLESARPWRHGFPCICVSLILLLFFPVA